MPIPCVKFIGPFFLKEMSAMKMFCQKRNELWFASPLGVKQCLHLFVRHPTSVSEIPQERLGHHRDIIGVHGADLHDGRIVSHCAITFENCVMDSVYSHRGEGESVFWSALVAIVLGRRTQNDVAIKHSRGLSQGGEGTNKGFKVRSE